MIGVPICCIKQQHFSGGSHAQRIPSALPTPLLLPFRMAAPCLELVLSRQDRAYVYERSHGLGRSAWKGSGDEPLLEASNALRCL